MNNQNLESKNIELYDIMLPKSKKALSLESLESTKDTTKDSQEPPKMLLNEPQAPQKEMPTYGTSYKYDISCIYKNQKDSILKQALFLQTPNVESTPNGLSQVSLARAFIILGIILFLCVPKIYLANNIYYTSKHIATLQTQYDMLLDENKRLKHTIEDLRYKFIILDK